MKRIIADKGRGFYHIVTKKIPHGAEMYAASTLYQYLYKATNAIVPYFSDFVNGLCLTYAHFYVALFVFLMCSSVGVILCLLLPNGL